MSIAYIQENIYLFIFIFIILCILIYKIQHTFLYHSTLPVFKQYEMWKWFQSPTIMIAKFDETSKFFNNTQISTISIADTEILKDDIENYCLDLKNNFLSRRQKLHYTYKPTFSYISSLHLHNSFMSTCKANQIIISRIFSRQLHLCMYRNKIQSFEEYKIQFNDFICTNPSFRKKQYTQQIIYTHMANICNQSNEENCENKIFMAKYENKMLPLIPFVSYYSYAYNISFLNGKLNENDITPVTITKINKNSIHLYHTFISYLKSTKKFQVFLHESLDKIKYLIQQNIIVVYVLHYKDDVYAMYVFHDPHMKYNDMNMIECISSVCHSECDYALFYDTFVYILNQMKYSILILECIAHNSQLHKYLQKQIKPLYHYPVTFNIVNYRQIPYYPKDCLFIL